MTLEWMFKYLSPLEYLCKDIHIHLTFVSRFSVINYEYAVTITTSSVNVCHNFLFS